MLACCNIYPLSHGVEFEFMIRSATGNTLTSKESVATSYLRMTALTFSPVCNNPMTDVSEFAEVLDYIGSLFTTFHFVPV